MNVLGGIHEPDAGTIEIDGVPADLHSPVDADTAGIAFIHQELLFFSTLTVAENMFISHLPSSRLPFIVDRQAATTKAGAALEMLDSGISPGARMEELSVGEKQVVEIARALAMGSDIVIFDEPSSSLSMTREGEALRHRPPTAGGGQGGHPISPTFSTKSWSYATVMRCSGTEDSPAQGALRM